MHIYIYICVNACVHISIYIYIYIYMCVCVYIHTCISMFYVCMYICIYAYIYICIYICAPVHACVYTRASLCNANACTTILRLGFSWPESGSMLPRTQCRAICTASPLDLPQMSRPPTAGTMNALLFTPGVPDHCGTHCKPHQR